MYKSNFERNGNSTAPFSIKELKKVQWRIEKFRLDSSDRTIAHTADCLYCIATKDNARYASFYEINSFTGEINYSIELKENVYGLRNEFSSPLLVGKLAYILYRPLQEGLCHKLYCIDIDQKKVLFSVDILPEGTRNSLTFDSLELMTRSSIIVHGESIFLGTVNGHISLFNKRTGQYLWTLALPERVPIGHLAYSEGFIFAQSVNRDLYAINISKKEIQWIFNPPEKITDIPVWAELCPLVHKDRVYAYGSLKTLYSLNKEDGTLMWEYSSNGSMYCSNFVTSGNKIIGKMPDSKLHAIDIVSGEKIWVQNIGKPIPTNSSPVVVGNSLLISSGGYLFCIDISSGKIISKWQVPFDMNNSSNVEYIIYQIINSITKITDGSPNLASISSPCVGEKAVFIATENGPDLSLFKLSFMD